MLKDKFWSSQSRDLFNSTPLVLCGVSCPSFWLERVPNFIKILKFIKNQELFHLPFMNGYSETGGLGPVRGLFLWDAPSPQLIDWLIVYSQWWQQAEGLCQLTHAAAAVSSCHSHLQPPCWLCHSVLVQHLLLLEWGDSFLNIPQHLEQNCDILEWVVRSS